MNSQTMKDLFDSAGCMVAPAVNPDQLLALRQERGLSQAAFAAEYKFSLTELQDIEKRAKPITSATPASRSLKPLCVK